jgi:ATP-dependent Lon protease
MTDRTLPEDALIILPVRSMVLFPGIVVPLAVGRDRSRAAAQEAVRLQRPLGVLLQAQPDTENPNRTSCIGSARAPTSCATSRAKARITPS